MITRMLENFISDLPPAEQDCAIAELSNEEIDRALHSISSIEGTLDELKAKLTSNTSRATRQRRRRRRR